MSSQLIILADGPLQLLRRVITVAQLPDRLDYELPVVRRHCDDPLCPLCVVVGTKVARYCLGRQHETGEVMLHHGVPAYFFDGWQPTPPV